METRIKKFYSILQIMKVGFDQIGWAFLILGGGVVIGQLIGFTGGVATLITFGFFYYAGKAHLHITKVEK